MKLKDRVSFFSFFLINLYEVSLVRIKEQVGEKRSTVGTHRNADYLLKKHVYITNTYLVSVEATYY